MQHRSPIGRAVLVLVLALSLAVGGVAAISATAANSSSVAGNTMFGLPGTVSVSVIHTNGMLHGRDSGSGALAQVLCLFACMGLTAAPSLPIPDTALTLSSYVVLSHIAGHDAGDQILNRPISPPPRAIATI